MSTATAAAPYRGILDDLPARGLSIPPPPRRREKVVVDAVKKLQDAHVGDRAKAERVIEDYGLTIEVARLRDTLARVAATNLHRLLLSIPGVPEALFNKAIEKQLDEETNNDGAVTDASVASIGTQVGSVATSLTSSLATLNATSQKFEESSRQIVDNLAKVVEALSALRDDDEYKETAPATGASGDSPGVGKTSSTKRSPAKSAPPATGAQR
ncbi:hypothetical protein IU486_31235 [Streptomyces gardneri]|uniref:hypothetical protein n=1 Tax=Nocardia abscessus TaxID=120957 RepID=UPI00189514BB|nr:hypothetical protein [Nocardia abscessus]MBF6169177.1 hypothetical protein [Streptomyces gardneri]MBF6475261.1 hypothetical protein [Nocardia abscessus]